jgi:hypothetical protein
MSCRLGSRRAEGEISDRRFFLRTRRVVRWVGIGLPRRVRLLAVTGGVISLHECDNYGGPRHLTKKPVQLLFCA